MKEEIWKDISEFEGYYQVSNYGRVRSVNRIDSNGKKRKGKIKRFGNASTKGYAIVCLMKKNKQYIRYVHRLVAQEFIGLIPKDKVVNHINHDQHDNRVENLEIITTSENIKHAQLNKGHSTRIIEV